MAVQRTPILQRDDGMGVAVHSLRGLYAITDDVLLAGCLLPAVRAALEGGCRLVQYRSKQPDAARRYREAGELLTLCHRYGAVLLVNDDVDLARAIGADGVHLGQEDMPLHEARRVLGDGAIIGVTCHNAIALAEKAQAGGADYVAFGRFFASGTKPSAVSASLPLLAGARLHLACPVVAIGGITLDNAGSVVDAGATMLAVVAGLFAPDPTDTNSITARAAAFQALFDNTV